jgi:hypothetical protein
MQKRSEKMLAAELTNAEIVDRFLNRIGVSFAAESAGWRATANDRQSEWKCVFRRPGKQWTVRFHMGSAHTEPPTAYDVLTCVVQENYEVEHDFDEMEDTGDSGTKKIQQSMSRQFERFKEFFWWFVPSSDMEAMSRIPDLDTGDPETENEARAALLGEDA